jgi:multiple sugar transport system substrate-binding protein
MSGRWKRIALLLVTTALVASVGGASIASAKISKGTGAEATNATLKIMGFGPGDEIANVRAAEAAAALGSNSVDNPRGGFNDQQFLAAVAARDVPDLVYLDRQKIISYAAKGTFVPLTSCIKNYNIDTKQYRLAALQEVTYKGKIYAIPEFTNPRTIIVNDRVAAAAGVSVNDFKTTDWAKLRATNKKALAKNGDKVTRIGFDPKIPEFFPMWAKANGVDLLSKDGLKANLNSKKSIEALSFAYSLIQDHGGWGPFKAFRDTWDFFGAKNQVAENQIGAWPMESFYYNVMAQNSPQVNITALPFTNKKGGPITMITGSGWAIPKGAKNPGLACRWIKAVTATESWVKAAKTRFDVVKRTNRPFTGVYTANKAADTKIYEDIYQKMGRADFDNAVTLLVAINRYSFTLPASPAGAEFNVAMQDAINRVLAGQQSPRAALNQAQKEAQAAIDKAKK